MARKTRPPKGRNHNGSRDQLLPRSSAMPLTPFGFLGLPPEIRNRVYMEAFGGKRIHLCNMIHEFGNIRHYTCPDDISSRCYCHGVERARSEYLYPASAWQKTLSHITRRKLNATILRTCRKIYDEAIGILYGSNTFDVNRKSPCLPLDVTERYPGISLFPLFEFTDRVRRPNLNYITRLEISWFFQDSPTVDEMALENRVSRSARTWSAHWGRIGREFPNLRQLVVCLIFRELINWVAGGYMFWALPMLKAVRGLRSCEIFVEYSKDRRIDPNWRISLDDLAAVMCSDSSSPENAPACVQKALQDYPVSAPSYSQTILFYVEIFGGFFDN